ncbi:hypothetical protein PF005_g31096 [Phytophthora fragariae]|uniref:Uncharacterized protein n=1 Tax=Phytophthora fragariae TaxID=53985 RepID=A0A6A3VAH4_9STRA|nr:hypothetical protein PF005_g31096 [Phytophthora fragariae]
METAARSRRGELSRRMPWRTSSWIAASLPALNCEHSKLYGLLGRVVELEPAVEAASGAEVAPLSPRS